MSTTWEQLEGAALSLARAGSIKDRLAEAFRSHLAEVNAEELPESLRQQFRVCHDALIRERPQPGEDAVRATVRKLSGERGGRARLLRRAPLRRLRARDHARGDAAECRR